MAISEANRPSLKRVTPRCRREDKIGFMVAIFVGFKQVERKTRLWPALEDVLPLPLNPCS